MNISNRGKTLQQKMSLPADKAMHTGWGSGYFVSSVVFYLLISSSNYCLVFLH